MRPWTARARLVIAGVLASRTQDGPNGLNQLEPYKSVRLVTSGSVLRGPTPTFMVKAWLADNPAWRCLYVRGIPKPSIPERESRRAIILSNADSNAGEFSCCRRPS